MELKIKKAFTLAETLITLTILGVVAALTVPNLVRRQVEASNRVKIKKAVGVYESMITKLAVQNNLKSNAAIQEWANADCSNSSDLFKVVKFLKVNNVETKCKFKTADGVFWDITDIQKPIIALKESDLNNETAQSNTSRAFYLFAQYDGTGILRVTEPTFNYSLSLSSVTPDKVNESVDRLYDFLAGKTTTNLNEIEVSEDTSSGGGSGTLTPEEQYAAKLAACEGEINCIVRTTDPYDLDSIPKCGAEKKNCVFYEDDDDMGCSLFCGWQWTIYNSSGNRVGYYRLDKDPNGKDYKVWEYTEEYNGNKLFIVRGPHPSSGEVFITNKQYKNSNGVTFCAISYDPDGSIYYESPSGCSGE